MSVPTACQSLCVPTVVLLYRKWAPAGIGDEIQPAFPSPVEGANSPGPKRTPRANSGTKSFPIGCRGLPSKACEGRHPTIHFPTQPFHTCSALAVKLNGVLLFSIPMLHKGAPCRGCEESLGHRGERMRRCSLSKSLHWVPHSSKEAMFGVRRF